MSLHLEQRCIINEGAKKGREVTVDKREIPLVSSVMVALLFQNPPLFSELSLPIYIVSFLFYPTVFDRRAFLPLHLSSLVEHSACSMMYAFDDLTLTMAEVLFAISSPVHDYSLVDPLSFFLGTTTTVRF